MGAVSVYFFSSLVALEAARKSQNDDNLLFFYDGKSLDEAPLNCINVPISTFYDYFLQTTHPQISQLNFDNVNFSDEIKSQITQNIEETIVAIQNQKMQIINTLLASEINDKNISVMIFSFLKHLVEGADDKTISKLITKLLKIIMYLKGHSYKQSNDIDTLISKLFTMLKTQKLNMHNIFLEFLLKNLQDKSMFNENRISCLKQIIKHKDMADIFNQFHYVKSIYPQSEFKEYLSELAKVVFSDDFFDLDTLEQKEKIYKFYYCSYSVYEFGKEFQEMYKIMYPIYTKAIKKELDELVMSLYYPLQFSWNGVAQTQEEHKQFNDEVELKLESFIKETMIQKYKIKPSTRKIKPNQKKIKVAFLVHRILNLSVNDVMISLLKSLQENSDQKYEFIVYDLNLMEMLGSDPIEVNKLKELGFKYVDLHERCMKGKYPLYSLVEKSLKVREALIDDKIDILIGYHNRAEYNFLFTSRTAPKQIYWSHGNFEYNIKNIDSRILHNDEALIYSSGKKRGFIFNYFIVPTKTQNSTINKTEIENIKKDFPKNSVFLGSIGRLVKLESDNYLEAVAQIMKKNPNTVYLACGSGDRSYILSKITKLNIQDRFYFMGQVNPDIYGHVIDLYLNTFPFSSGESLNEYLLKDKVAVILQDIDHPVIKHLFENKQDKEYKRIFAYSEADYIELADAILKNEEIRNYLIEQRKNHNQYAIPKQNQETYLKFIEAIA